MIEELICEHFSIRNKHSLFHPDRSTAHRISYGCASARQKPEQLLQFPHRLFVTRLPRYNRIDHARTWAMKVCCEQLPFGWWNRCQALSNKDGHLSCKKKQDVQSSYDGINIILSRSAGSGYTTPVLGAHERTASRMIQFRISSAAREASASTSWDDDIEANNGGHSLGTP
jgi:hypothetical protein